MGVDGKIREEIKNECVWLGEERGLGGENGGPTKIKSSLNGEREREREREIDEITNLLTILPHNYVTLISFFFFFVSFFFGFLSF